MAKFLDLEGLNYFWDKIKSWVQERFASKSDLYQKLNTLISGLNIKTINNKDILGKGNIEIESGAVDSVNGKTGNVVLSASDVGALSNLVTIPTKVSDLNNDLNFTSVSIDRKVSTGTNIADITIDGTTTLLYAPTSGGGSGEENIIESISVNGTQLTITNKNVDIAVPTKTSDLNNDSGFITGYTETDPTVPSWAKQPNKPSYNYSEIGNTPDLSGFITKSVNDLTNYYLKSETYTKAEVAALIGAIQQFHYEIYPTLPASGESNVLYLIGPTGSGSDRYEEYVYSNSAFTKIGDTSIDLSGYVTTSALNTTLAGYQTKIDSTHKLDYSLLDNTPNIPTISVPTTYAALKALRNGGGLSAGTWYRITDYVCTTTQDNTQSAVHAFDVIVRADDASHLNENAFAAHHTGDTYFANCKLEAWELKYCLDNDTNRFAWADDENGKGVIFYMKDEWNNECPYDFKNIMFKRWAVSEVTDQKMTQDAIEALNETFVFDGDETKFQTRFGYQGSDCSYGTTVHVVNPNDTGWYYTFSIIMNDVESGEYDLERVEDGSIKGNNFYNDEGSGGFYDNTIKPRYNNMASDEDGIDGAQVLNNIVLNGYYENSDDAPYIYGCNNNSFGGNCYNNTFGNNCYWNSFGNNCQVNSFGNGCNNSSFGNDCGGNTFGNDCYNNSFGNSCTRNTFGNGCFQNSFGNNCGSNTFGNGCNWNSFGNYCQYNSFGNGCFQNSFGNDCQNNSFRNYCQTITVFDGVQNCSVTGGSQNAPVKNAQILNGTAGASSANKLTIAFDANKAYTQVAGKDANGNLHIWKLGDFVEKSNTTGLLKNDGTVDTTQYGTYSKPSGGIPVSDLASGVIPTVPVQDVTVGGTSVVNNGTAVIPQEVFVAEYGVTTYAEIKNAYDTNKVVAFLRQGNVYYLTSFSNNTFYFDRVTADYRYSFYLNSSATGSISIRQIETPSNRVSTISGNETNTTKYPNTKAVADALGKWGIISQTQTWSGTGSQPRTCVMSDLVYGTVPQANIDLFESAGATFNATSGYFELNGLTDISYEEMKKIYNDTVGLVPINSSRMTVLAYYSQRTTLGHKATASFATNLQYMCYNSNLVNIKFDGIAYSTQSNAAGVFQGSSRLRRVIGTISLGTGTALLSPCSNCYSLEHLYIKDLKGSLTIKESSLFELDSVVYIVQNAANTSAITITLHADALARCTADTTEYTYSGNTYTGIVALANAKNITLAS